MAVPLRSTVVENNGFFVQARFEQTAINDSLAAYISVVGDFCHSIINITDKSLQRRHAERISRLVEHLLDDDIAVSIVPALGKVLKLFRKSSS